MTDDEEYEFEFSEMHDELRAYRIERDTGGMKHYILVARGEEASRLKERVGGKWRT